MKLEGNLSKACLPASELRIARGANEVTKINEEAKEVIAGSKCLSRKLPH
jgi:hypothetical protein